MFWQIYYLQNRRTGTALRVHQNVLVDEGDRKHCASEHKFARKLATTCAMGAEGSKSRIPQSSLQVGNPWIFFFRKTYCQNPCRSTCVADQRQLERKFWFFSAWNFDDKLGETLSEPLPLCCGAPTCECIPTRHTNEFVLQLFAQVPLPS